MIRFADDLPQQNTIINILADGVTAAFNFNFLVPIPVIGQNADIAVYVTTIGDVPNPQNNLIDPANYVVTFNVNPVTGGTVTFNTGFVPVNGTYVTLSRDMIYSLDTQFSDVQNFSGSRLDKALQRLELQMQQVASLQMQRTPSYAVNSFLPLNPEDIQLPVLGQNQFWIKQGSAILAVTYADSPSASVLRDELASQVEGADGAGIVGYYSATQSAGMTVHNILNQLETNIGNAFDAGDVLPSYASKSLPWVRLNDGTIGNASSNATTRANADTLAAFSVFWNFNPLYFPMVNSAGAPVARGVSAASDFGLNYAIQIGYTSGRSMANVGQAVINMAFTASTSTSQLTILDSTSFYTGTLVTLTNTGGALPSPLGTGINYYAIPIDGTHIKLATTLANALAGTPIPLTTTGSGTNIVTITMPNYVTGQYLGEPTHAQTINELPTHDHLPPSGFGYAGGSGNLNETSGGIETNGVASQVTGGGQAFNIMAPTFNIPLWLHL